jgi:hypothetical protein
VASKQRTCDKKDKLNVGADDSSNLYRSMPVSWTILKLKQTRLLEYLLNDDNLVCL